MLEGDGMEVEELNHETQKSFVMGYRTRRRLTCTLPSDVLAITVLLRASEAMLVTAL